MGNVPWQESVFDVSDSSTDAPSGTFKMALLVCLRSLDGARACAARTRRVGKKNMIRGLARN
jgi:hypothetical protein